MQEHQEKVEKKMEEMTKSLPKMADGTKTSVVNALPVASAVLGVIGLYLSWKLWDDGRDVSKASNSLGEFAKAFGVDNSIPSTGLTYWVAMVSIALASVLALVAFQGLKAKSKAKGWNLLFYAALLNAVFGVFVMLSEFREAGTMVLSVGVSLVALYALFQVKPHYK
jgi:hypothetical protein